MQGNSVTITVPMQVYNDLQAMSDDEKQRLREEYPDLSISNNYVELWIIEQLIAASGEKLYDIPREDATVTTGGDIERERDDDSGRFF